MFFSTYDLRQLLERAEATGAATVSLGVSIPKVVAPEYLTIEQAADYLGYSVSGLRKLAKRGAVRYTQSKPKAPLRFRREWLDELGKAAPAASARPRHKSAHGLNASLLG